MKKIFLVFGFLGLFAIQLLGVDNNSPKKNILQNIKITNEFDESNRLYTQIIEKPFNIRLYSNTAENQYSYDGETAYIYLINAENFTPINFKQNNKDISKIDIDIDALTDILQNKEIPINGIAIANKENGLYRNLRFRMVVIDKNKKIIGSTYSDAFSARPKGYVLNLEGNTKIGGRRYQNLSDIKAIDALGNEVLGYNTMLETLNEKNIIKWTQDEKCKDGENIIEPNKRTNMRIKFDNGLGSSYNVCYDNEKEIELNDDNINANKCYFSYPDIGPTTINIYDDTWTEIDHNDDCIEGESKNVANNGKIGCNIELQSDYYKFMLDKIMLKSKELSDKLVNMTYYLKDDVYTKSKERLESMMAADLKLDLNATLADGTTPRLYTKNCYAKDVNIDVNVTKNLDKEVYYYGVEETADELDKFAIKIKSAEDDDATKEKNDGKFTISKDAFHLGEASVSLKLNLGREHNKPKAYKNITPDVFTLSGKDEDDVKLEESVVASDSEANFYYGRVFAPNYDIYAKSGEASVYYGVYFSGDESKEDKEKIKNFITSNETKTLEECKIPQLKDYYINPAFSGKSTNEYLGANLKISENNAAEKENGKEKLILTYNGVEFPKTINIKITPNDEAKKYLLFDKFAPKDEKPIDTSFNATFYSLDKGGWTGSGEPGKVMDIGGEKGNRRIDW
ncbi:hypothetical protein CIG11343_0658 [Campylobacter iguaniorum]|uniref:hypothetical protein n=1 Tax=Campylobacter iguaniorum TaxID=1244531 RepID=UPI0007C89981|nr:hypothetical protein [Campylobacter iguaniorum]ANE35701.1 hypothetical protein CIG11343_0658 [Campylobacter iguaniorum]